MADAYKAWLQEQVAYYTDLCSKSAAERGYPGKLRFAEQSYRENLDAYEDCLCKYEALCASPALSSEDTLS